MVRLLLQMVEKLACVGARLLGERSGSTAEEYFAAPVTAFGAEIDHMVGGLDDIEMVFRIVCVAPPAPTCAEQRRELRRE